MMKVDTTALPVDIYEEWLKKQIVKPKESKPEVQVPLNSYEDWLRKQVKKRIEPKM